MGCAIYRRGFLALSVLLPLLAWADFDAGQKGYDEGDYETALREWQPLADAGDMRAQFGLGMLYADGFGVPMDDAQSLHWFGLSAEQGYADAQYRLAVMHQNGWGVPMSDEVAAEWFAKAAEQGVTEAQIALGQIYAAEYSAIYDPVKAYKWLAIAARLHDRNADIKRDDIAATLSAEQLEQANAMVDEWMQAHPSLVED